MILEGTAIEGKEVILADLDDAMEELGFVRWAWDYKRATYDYKYEDKKTGNTFYLRVPASAMEGSIEEVGLGNEAVLKIGQPYLGKHLHPHGFDYEYDFPQEIINSATKKIEALLKNL